METIIVGVGNPIMTDDAIGIVTARNIYDQLSDKTNIDLIEASVGGFELVEMVVDYQKAIIIDAIRTEDGQPGDYYLLDLESAVSSEQPALTHQVSLMEGLDLAKRLGMNIPEYLRVYGIEAKEIYTFGTELTEPLRSKVSQIAKEIVENEFGG